MWSAGSASAGEFAGRVPGRRSLWAFAAVAAGFSLARYGAPSIGSAVWFGLAAGVLAIAAATLGRSCRVALFAATTCLAGGWFALRVLEHPPNDLGSMLDARPLAEPTLLSVEGVVEDWAASIEPPRGEMARFARSAPGFVFPLRIWRAQTDGPWAAAGGRLSVRVDGDPVTAPESFAPGSVVRATGRVIPVRRATNPGEPDWVLLARQDGRAGTLRLPSVELISSAAPAGWSEHVECGLRRALGLLRRSAARSFGMGVPETDPPDGPQPPSQARAASRPARAEQARALLAAMLLGERAPALDEVNRAFTRLGLVHLVAISGFNLAVMAAVALSFLRISGDRGWLEPAAMALLITGYMLVLPLQAPILRAGFMALIFLAAEAFGRRYDRLTLLGWVAVIALAIRPMDLWSVGFQLSFGIVAALMAFGGRVHGMIWGERIRGVLAPAVRPGPLSIGAWAAAGWLWCVEAFKGQVSASVVAWSVATPVLIWQTGLFSPLAAFTTLVVLPMTVVVLWVGYAVLFLAAILPGDAIGPTAGWLLERLAVVLVDVVMTLDRIPGAAFRLPSVSTAWAAAAAGLAIYWLGRGTRRDARAWLATLLVCVWLAAELTLGPRWAGRHPVRIDTLAVGDGTCHLVRCAAGGVAAPEALLWDCGSLTPGLGERRIPDALRAVGAAAVPTAIVTHAHIDHFSALPELVETVGIRRVLISHQFERAARAHPEGPAADLLAQLGARGVPVRAVAAGDTLSLGAATLTFLWPPADRDFKDPNDASLVGRIDVETAAGPRSALMCGDVSRESVPELLPAWDAPAPQSPAVRADILELPHHGAYIEPAAELVRLAAPSAIVQSTGPRRAREGRWDGVRAGLPRGASWLITAADGAITTRIARDGSVSSVPATPANR